MHMFDQSEELRALDVFVFDSRIFWARCGIITRFLGHKLTDSTANTIGRKP